MTGTPVLEFRAEASGGEVPSCAARLERDVRVDGMLVRALLLTSGAPVPGGSDAPHTRVKLEQGDEDGFIVEEPVTGVFGNGPTPELAFEDFVQALFEYRLVLLREAPKISRRLASHLRFIEELIGR